MQSNKEQSIENLLKVITTYKNSLGLEGLAKERKLILTELEENLREAQRLNYLSLDEIESVLSCIKNTILQERIFKPSIVSTACSNLINEADKIKQKSTASAVMAKNYYKLAVGLIGLSTLILFTTLCLAALSSLAITPMLALATVAMLSILLCGFKHQQHEAISIKQSHLVDNISFFSINSNSWAVELASDTLSEHFAAFKQ